MTSPVRPPRWLPTPARRRARAAPLVRAMIAATDPATGRPLTDDMQGEVRAETDAIGEQELTPDDVPRLRYTVQVLHEALRLCPPAPSVPRLITRDIEVDGYLVKAGTLCTVGVYAMHRGPALWDDPLRFDPQRFTPENATGRDRWHYIPFSAGPRTCIGDHFAMLEATLALATIIRRTEIRSLDNDFPLAPLFTLVAAAPIRAQVNARTK